MSPRQQSLFTLFGDLTGGWPSSAVREHTGDPHGDPAGVATWLTVLDSSVRVRDVRTGASDGRVAVQAALSVDPAVGFGSTYPDGWPFVLASMPDVEFLILPFTDGTHSVNLFASTGDSGIELLLEGLPVEIRLPAGLLEPHPDLPGAPDGTLVVDTAVDPGGEFEAGRLDDLRLVLRRGDVTSIFAHVRIYMSSAYEFDVQPAVPVSFGECALSGVPCVAVHDFRLVPSPVVALDRIEWLRHRVDPWIPRLTGPYDGLFSVRSVDIDEQSSALKDAVHWLNDRRKYGFSPAEFVLGDLVVPFFGPLPVPRHVTAGVRRNVLAPNDADYVYAFDRAPVYLQISQSPALHFVVESLYFQSQPTDGAAGPPSGLASGMAPGTYSEGIGLTFIAELVIGEDQSPQQGIEVGLQEDYTLVAGYKRAYSTVNELPMPNPGAEGTLDAMLSWRIASAVIIDVIAIRVGLSLARKFTQGLSFANSTLLTVDLFVAMPPTGSEDSAFRLRALDGSTVTFTLENVGWRLGQLHLEGLALPDGVVAYFWGFPLLIYELGLTAEDGATYVSFSGGVLIKRPAGLDGGVTVRRLRFRVTGNQATPAVKVDGFFLTLRNSDQSLRIDAGGYYSEYTADGGARVREVGLTGTVAFKVGANSYAIGLDLIVGDSRSPADSFDFFMVQAFYRATFAAPTGLELTGARLLYARDMVPKLETFDAESRELRYYRWYRDSNNPLTVSGDRRLASWKPEDGSWALGVGASASYPAFGKVLDIALFILGVDGASEKGLLVVGEVHLFSNPQPVGYLAVEFDRRNDRASLLVGIDARASSMIKSAPAWMDNVGKFTGTLYISSSPTTVAIGRLADQSTWLTARFDVQLWLKTSLVVAICFEYVDHGPKGVGMTARIEGGIGHGAIRLTYNAGWTVTAMVLTTGSSDYAALITIKAGMHFELWGFLRIGVSAEIDFRIVGTHPARGELTAEIKLDTPWFLPDVTFRLDCQFGQLAPADLASAVQPLRSGGANEPATNRQLPTHLERFDSSWDGAGVAPLHSVNELTAPTRPEADRLANLATDTELQPVAIDATIAVTWSVAVNDKLGLGSGTATGLGDQSAGDLTLTYDLVGIAVRRRARFGPDRSWQPLDQKLALPPDFSSSSGVQLSGSFSPQVLNKTWDVDVQIEGEPAAKKKLLLNGIAPYEFTTASPETDEELIRRTPSWPCCQRPTDKYLVELFHALNWGSATLGEELTAPAAWRFATSASRLRFLRPAWARKAGFAGLAPETIVATASAGAPGVVARADFDEDAAFVRASVAWAPGTRLTLVAIDGTGREVGRRDLGSGTGTYQRTMFGATGPIRRLELRAYEATWAGPANPLDGSLLEVDDVGFVGLRDYLDMLTAEKACDAGVPAGSGGFDGSGKLAFLPNHEYEVKLTTHVTVGHPSVPPSSADVEEFVYFRTKGLPGLNAVARTGDELEPYVRAAYAGGRTGLVYREEPVTLAFSEGFAVAVPLEARPASGAPEQATLLELQLLAEPDLAVGAETAFTTTTDDWIVTHRGSVPPPGIDPFPWRGVRTRSSSTATGMVSDDPLRQRAAVMTQRPAVTCALADPIQVTGTVLVAPPQGGGPDPDASPPGSAELWTAGSHFTAAVRAKGAGFVDRRPFADGDETALAVRELAAPASWTVNDGQLRAAGSGLSVAAFGDPEWDHLTVVAGLVPGATRSGIAFGLPAAGIDGALFALVTGAPDSPAQLLVCRGDAGGQLSTLGAAALPIVGAASAALITLQVTLFDDRIRATVGDVTVEADRADTSSGQVGLVADGPAAFGSLEVRGLELYEFPFAVSRFRSFADHIASWGGRLDAAAADVFGAGTSSQAVATLWNTTAPEIQAAMSPDSASSDRERVFAAWVAGLGLPLKDELNALEFTRIVEADQTRALLIESPEPLDFSQEITLTLTHRVRTGPGPVQPPRPPIGPVLAAAAPTQSVRDRLESLALAPPTTAPGGTPSLSPNRGGILPPPEQAILGVEPVGPDLALTLAPALSGAGILCAVAVEASAAVLYEGPVRPGLAAGQPATMTAKPVGPLGMPPPGSDLIEVLTTSPAGTVLLTSRDRIRLLGVWSPAGSETDVEIPVQLLQSGDARRALVIPLAGASATSLPPDHYRLNFVLARRRWQTTDPTDAINTYQSSTTLLLEL